MSALLDHPATLALASTLLHFLWQGAILGLTAFVILRYARLTAGTRYVVRVMALAAMLVSPVVTFGVALSRATATPTTLLPSAPPPRYDALSLDAALVSTSSGATSNGSAVDPVSGPQVPNPRADAAVPAAMIRTILLSLWFAGVIVLSLRLFGGWIVAWRLAIKAVRPVAPEIQSLATRVAGRLALDRVVRVVESSAVTVPAMIGWMKPVVLLPAAALAGLSPGQVEALIAHELAHVRRHDYLVNLIQTIVETLLFYHPAVWWISRQVRRDREHCCDDLAVGVCDRLTYVTALASLAAMSTRPRLALAANDGSLLGRVRRILGQSPDNLHGGGWLATLMIVTLAGGAIASTAIARPTSNDQTTDRSGVTSIQLGQGQITATGRFTVSNSQPAAGQGALFAQESSGAQSSEAAAAQAQYELARLLAIIDEQRARNLSQDELKSKVLEQLLKDQGPFEQLMKDQVTLEQLLKDKVTLDRLMIDGVALEQLLKDKVTLEQLVKKIQAADVANQRAREDRERLLQEDAQKYERLLEMERQLDRERIEIEKQVRETQGRARISALESELQAARANLDRAKQQVEAGVVDRSVLIKMEAELRNLESQLMAAAAEHQMLGQEMNLRLREAEVRREAERRRVDYERALRETATGERDARYEELARKLQELEALLAARGEGRVAIAERSNLEPVSNPNEPVRAGDQLVIEIAGEPDLPREYEVRADGTIRLPLIGPVRVVGLTARQVREAVAKQITDRGLGKSPGVAVSLRRPRG